MQRWVVRVVWCGWCSAARLWSVCNWLDPISRSLHPVVQIHEMEEVVRQSQRYSTTLQAYNTRCVRPAAGVCTHRHPAPPPPPSPSNHGPSSTQPPMHAHPSPPLPTAHSLQNDLNAEKARRDEVVKAREELQGQVAELGGLVKSGERMLQLEQGQVQKLRDEREAAAREVAVLRIDLDATRADRERLTAEGKELREELDRWVEGLLFFGGGSGSGVGLAVGAGVLG